MSLRQQIGDALKEAQKERDRLTVATLRLVRAALTDRDIAARSSGGGGAVSDDEVIDLLVRMVRQREGAAAEYRQGGREDLAAREEAEIGVIRRFMPSLMSASETEAAVDSVLAEVEATGLKDMKRVMAALKLAHPGRIDRAAASVLVKQRLG